ncbi:MAG: hypothetical protein GWP91_16620 [Rhodobacterales bacterium]|nr:hypothetical protein [Rhodobacterales bacterium]
MSSSKLFAILTLCATVGCGWGDGLERDDLDRLCKVAETVQNDASVNQKQRLAEVGKRVGAEQGGPALKKSWRAIQKAPPKLRKVAYNEMLDQAGAKGFKCAPLEQLLNIK